MLSLLNSNDCEHIHFATPCANFVGVILNCQAIEYKYSDVIGKGTVVIVP